VARRTDVGRLRLTVDAVEDERQSDLNAMLGTGRFRNTTRLLGDDQNRRVRLVVDQELEPADLWSRGQWRAWYQDSDTRQETNEARPLAAVPIDLFRRFEFSEETLGLGVDLETEWFGLGRAQRLGYGFEIQKSELRQRRDAIQTTLGTGETTQTVLGENFPLRDFPVTDVFELGVYAYDEIRLWDGGPSLSPGVRFEYYELESRNDPLFESAFPETPLTDLDTTAWAPSLGLVWPLFDRAEVFAQYARAFRSPPFSDVNIGLDIPIFNVRAIPNPDLEPERGRTLEAGFRWRAPRARFELVLYRNQFKDFISTRAFVGVDPGSGRLLFQSINRERVRIEGAEIRSTLPLPGPFSLDLSGEWSRGEDRETGRSLPELGPPQAIIALDYSPSPDLDFTLATSVTRDQRRLVDEEGEALFSAPGSTVVDLLMQWRPSSKLSVSAGLFNLTDERSWRHASVIGRPAGDPTLPLLAEPGRSLRATLRWYP